MALHRVTGLVIVALSVHAPRRALDAADRPLLAWSSFLSLVTAKSFLALEVVLIAAVLFHGLNGIRVALVGSGIAVPRERALFWAGTAIGTAAAIIYAALHILGAV